MKNKTYLLLGSNIGDPKEHIQKACNKIDSEIGEICKASSFYITAPWGGIEQPDFYNLVIEVKTDLSATAVLQKVLMIEKLAGRERKEKYGPRIIDIDILFYNTAIINEPGLTVPHPLIQERKFALTPLAEIKPGLLHPVFLTTILQLLAECKDKQEVRKINETVIY